MAATKLQITCPPCTRGESTRPLTLQNSSIIRWQQWRLRAVVMDKRSLDPRLHLSRAMVTCTNSEQNFICSQTKLNVYMSSTCFCTLTLWGKEPVQGKGKYILKETHPQGFRPHLYRVVIATEQKSQLIPVPALAYLSPGPHQFQLSYQRHLAYVDCIGMLSHKSPPSRSQSVNIYPKFKEARES